MHHSSSSGEFELKLELAQLYGQVELESDGESKKF